MMTVDTRFKILLCAIALVSPRIHAQCNKLRLDRTDNGVNMGQSEGKRFVLRLAISLSLLNEESGKV